MGDMLQPGLTIAIEARLEEKLAATAVISRMKCRKVPSPVYYNINSRLRISKARSLAILSIIFNGTGSESGKRIVPLLLTSYDARDIVVVHLNILQAVERAVEHDGKRTVSLLPALLMPLPVPFNVHCLLTYVPPGTMGPSRVGAVSPSYR